MSKGHTLTSQILGHCTSVRSLYATRMHHARRGDTLIEVAIAIAIFSLVAIGVVSVVNGSTSAAQNALEVTVTREEIDAQAEALRYIHNSYIAGGRSNSADNEKYRALWNAIKSYGEHDDATLDAILNYNPSTCAELYDDNNQYNIFRQHAFIINTHYLGDPIDYTDSATHGNRGNYESNTIQASADGAGAPNININDNTIFTAPATYPRVLYNSTFLGGTADSLLDQEGNSAGADTDQYFSDRVYNAEGIYIVAVKDDNTTAIINGGSNGNSGTVSYESAFYDFYIRSCWFAPGSERPSTISTVIRLQDPEEMMNYAPNNAPTIDVTFHKNDGSDPEITHDSHVATTVTEVAAPTWIRSGYTLAGWSIYADADLPTYTGNTVPAINGEHYYAVWVPATTPTPEPEPEPEPEPVPDTFDLEITLRWTAAKDLDAYFEIPGAGTVYYNRKNITSGDTTVSLSNDHRGSNINREETITATNLHRDQTYYYYVGNFTDRSSTGDVFTGTGATVTVNGMTFDVSSASGSGPYWYVFKIENGQIIPMGNISTAARS